ncbi:MAG: arylsulfatase, partial [Akkermansiaceae bacterium]|nr:arylsulfatase [Akkermansiaceae bacterium]
IRWPGKIPAGKVSDEIVADLDWYSTLAHLIGEEKRIPGDRPVDSINQADFLLGKQENSNREHVVTFVGDRIFAVKWRTLKVHYYTAEGTFSPIVEHTFPPVYDIKNDPGETRELWRSEGYSHIWVMRPVMAVVGKLQASMKQYPNIAPGQDFAGYR